MPEPAGPGRINESAIMVDGAAKQTDETAQQLAEASEAQSKQIEDARIQAAIDKIVAESEEPQQAAMQVEQ